MTVRVYRSTDAGAPVLTGVAGSLVALLDACLVNGYGAQPAAGWTKAYAAANKGAYLQNTVGSNNPAGMYLYVDDSGPGGGGGREARVCGFETMTAINPTGTGQFPTSGQSNIGTGMLVCRKSATADAVARQWTLIANGQSFYLFTETGDVTTPLGACAFFFGDFKSYKTGDQYAVFILARQVENTGGAMYEPLQIVYGNNLNSKFFGHYAARSWTGLGGSVQCCKSIDAGKLFPGNTGFNGDAGVGVNTGQGMTIGRLYSTWQLATPNGPDGALWLSPVYIGHSGSLRGYLPGLWGPLHDRPLGHNDTVTIASGVLNGKSMLCQQFMALMNNNTDAGEVLVEYSDTWS